MHVPKTNKTLQLLRLFNLAILLGVLIPLAAALVVLLGSWIVNTLAYQPVLWVWSYVSLLLGIGP